MLGVYFCLERTKRSDNFIQKFFIFKMELYENSSNYTLIGNLIRYCFNFLISLCAMESY